MGMERVAMKKKIRGRKGLPCSASSSLLDVGLITIIRFLRSFL